MKSVDELLKLAEIDPMAIFEGAEKVISALPGAVELPNDDLSAVELLQNRIMEIQSNIETLLESCQAYELWQAGIRPKIREYELAIKLEEFEKMPALKELVRTYIRMGQREFAIRTFVLSQYAIRSELLLAVSMISRFGISSYQDMRNPAFRGIKFI